MTEKTLTTENIKPAIDALRGELAPWPVMAMKQDRLNAAQLNAANSGITSSLVAQIIANTAAIRALESAITGTGLRPLVVASLPAIGTQGILYIVPVTTYDPDTDADVVNYSNEYLWIVAPDAPVTEGYYEQVGQTGIVINNGQLTITVNGTSVGTFTANQSGDTTAAITVPTNADYVDLSTSQTVTGGKTWTGEQTFSLPIVGSITGTASKAIADEDGTSIKTGYVNVAGDQTVSGQKTFSANIHFTSGLYQRNTTYEIGTTPASNINITQFLADKDSKYTGCLRNAISTTGLTSVELEARNKVGSGALSPTGVATSSTFKVEVQPDGSKTLYFDGSIRNNVLPYATNTYALGSSSYQWSSVYAQTYYYNGTAWGLDKANTWTENQNFTNSGWEQGVTPANLTSRYLQFLDKNNSSCGAIGFHQDPNGYTFLNILAGDKYANGAKSTSGSLIRNQFRIGTTSAGVMYQSFDGYWGSNLTPLNNNTYDLGTSTNKWKTLNGVNPGALSLPDLSKQVALDVIPPTGETSVNWSNGINSFTPPANGWISIRHDNCKFIQVYQNTNNRLGVTSERSSYGKIVVSLPVLGGSLYSLFMDAQSGTVHYLFYPCLGNV